MKSFSFLPVTMAFLGQNIAVLGLAPMKTAGPRINSPSVSSASSTQLKYINDGNLDAICANTTFCSLWQALPAMPQPPQQQQQELTISKSLSKLHPGDRVSGQVVKILPYGALVQTSYDIPGPTPGCALLHASRLTKGMKLEIGQVIEDARVVSVNRRENVVHISLRDQTEEAPIPLGALQVGDEIQGTISRVMDYGAFVNVGSKRDALLHKSRITKSSFVNSVRDFVSEGQRVTVRITSRDGKKMAVSMT